MSDKYYAVIVTFDKTVHEDDFEAYEKLLGAIRGVASIVPLAEDMDSIVAKERAKAELKGQLWEVLK